MSNYEEQGDTFIEQPALKLVVYQNKSNIIHQLQLIYSKIFNFMKLCAYFAMHFIANELMCSIQLFNYSNYSTTEIE